MENENGNENPSNNETDGQQPETTPESKDDGAAALKEKYKELEEKNRQLFARAKTAEGFEFDDSSKRWVKKEKAPATTASKVAPEATTDELTETELDYLDLKGITEQEDISVIQSVKKRTGAKVRDLLGDDYVASKLKSNKEKRAITNATPTSQRSSQGQGDMLNKDLAEYERTKKLPDDFERRRAIVNALEARHRTDVPPWRR